MKKYTEWIFLLLGGVVSVGGCIGYVSQEQKQKQEIETKNLAGYYNNVDSRGNIKNIGTLVPPKNWTTYRIAGAFVLSVPNTIELKDTNLRTRTIKWNNERSQKEIIRFINDSVERDLSEIAFQQKGLAAKEKDALNTYSRIMIQVTQGKAGDYLKSCEHEELNVEDIHAFQEFARQSTGGFEIMGTPQVRWIKLENIYGVEVEHIRKGVEQYTTHVFTYFFFNDNKMANIILSYRQQDSQKWEEDFSNIIRTFKWIN